MRIDIDDLTYSELVDLNNRVVERLKFLDQMHAHAEMLELRIGQRVQFETKGSRLVVGIVAKYNKKTVTVVSEDGERWRVSPGYLSTAEFHSNESG